MTVFMQYSISSKYFKFSTNELRWKSAGLYRHNFIWTVDSPYVFEQCLNNTDGAFYIYFYRDKTEIIQIFIFPDAMFGTVSF